MIASSCNFMHIINSDGDTQTFLRCCSGKIVCFFNTFLESQLVETYLIVSITSVSLSCILSLSDAWNAEVEHL